MVQAVWINVHKNWNGHMGLCDYLKFHLTLRMIVQARFFPTERQQEDRTI